MGQLKQFVLTVLVALVSNLSVNAYDFSAVNNEGIVLYYTIKTSTAPRTVELTFPESSLYSGDIIIPSTVLNNGISYSVVSIGSSAFKNCTDVTSINIPNTITSINSGAFENCTGLTEICLPSSLITLNSTAFQNCSNLTQINVDENNEFFYSVDGVLYKNDELVCCPMTRTGTYEVLSGMYKIADYAFYGCNVSKVVLPNGIEEIGTRAFQNCVLDEINLPESITTINGFAFCGCTNLTHIDIPNNVSVLNDQTFYRSGLEEITIPANITRLYNAVFGSCPKLKKAIVQGGFTRTTYDDYKGSNDYKGTFSNCTMLNEVTIQGELFAIASGAFKNCTNLEKVNIESNLTAIDYDAFQGCGKLTEINIPSSVNIIRWGAFKGCTSLPSVSLPKTITNIPKDLFYGCSSLTSIIIPEGVTTIGESAFYNCNKLESIHLPSTITSIGTNAFNMYSNKVFKTFICDVVNPAQITLNNYAFQQFPFSICTLYVPLGSRHNYSVADMWKNFSTIEDFTHDDPNETVTLIDNEPYTRFYDSEIKSISYTRNFKNTNWQPLYLPFAMSYDDWKDYADVAYINNVHQWDDDKDGTVDRTILEFITKTSGSIEPNKPYVIRPKQTGEVTFTSKNTTLYAAPATDGYVDCMSTTTKYTLYGTYHKKADMYENGYYAMAGGGFKQADNASVTLSPFRIYMKIEDRTGAGAIQNAPKRIDIMVDGVMDDDNDETGIQTILPTADNGNENVYNLTGQKVGRGYKGIAIKNGKKYLIK